MYWFEYTVFSGLIGFNNYHSLLFFRLNLLVGVCGRQGKGVN